MLHRLDAVRLHVVDEGQGDPILFLHGVGGSWRHFEPQLNALSDRFRCIALDQRGFGRSGEGAEYTIEALADDAARLCEQLGITQTNVVGLSMGGMVAQSLAARYPELVNAIVLSNTTGYSDPALRDMVVATCEMVRNGGLQMFLEATAAMTWAPATLTERPALVRSFAREQAGNDPEVYASILDDIGQLDHRELLPTIKVPVLVVRGDHDALTPPTHTEMLLELLPDARLVALPDAGHMSPLEAPDAFTTAVAEFFVENPIGG